MADRISVIGWTRRGDRPTELADVLGGEARVIFTPKLAHPALLPLRYATCALIMVAYLARRRPDALVVVNPPLWPGLIGWAYSRLAGARLVLDSHPGGFGAQGHSVERRLQAIHRFLVRRAAGVLVTTQHWIDVVESWGGTARIVHEPPRDRDVPVRGSDDDDDDARPIAMFVCIFAPDEPVGAVIDAARLAPHVEWWITGDAAKAPPGALDDLPANIRLTGYLGPADYDDALIGADVVVALTTEPTSIMRAAYEAVYALRPLVVSDHPDAVEVFPHAVATANHATDIAAAVDEVLARPDPDGAAWTARAAQQQMWVAQRSGLEQIVHGTPSPDDHPPAESRPRREAVTTS